MCEHGVNNLKITKKKKKKNTIMDLKKMNLIVK